MSNLREPAWLEVARQDIGIAEIPGKAHNPRIQQMLLEVGAWWTDDETPWCGTAMGDWMRRTGIAPPKGPWKARNWLDWGQELAEPTLGCVAVLDGGKRGAGSGHVTLIVGVDYADRLMGLGANQRNRVGIDPFLRSRVLPHGFRWPTGFPLGGIILPRVGSTGTVSTSEG